MGKAPVLNSGLGSVFQEEGPASALGADSLPNKQLQSLMKRFPQMSRGEALKGLGLGGLPQVTQDRIGTPTDITRPIDLKSALRELRSIERPQASPSMPSIDDIMGADPSVFDVEGPEKVKFQKTPLPAASDEAVAQKLVKSKKAEDFRANEAEIAKDMMPEMGGDPQDVQKGLEDSFSQAMADFIGNVRGTGPGDKEMSLADYKKEFAEATGLDVSGKVNKGQALMAMGLALMQSRMGKGFNVGKILGTIGAAGQQALPMLEKAKDKAQAAALAAGKYALQTRDSDRAKDEVNRQKKRQRGKYWVYQKGGKGTEFANFDKGEFVDLNEFELNKLIENKDFAGQYEFIDASDRLAILQERAKGVDLGDMWDSYELTSLIGGAAKDLPPELQVLAAPANANYKGLTPTRYKLAEDPEDVRLRFMGMQKSIDSGRQKFETLLKNLDAGVAVPDQILGGMKQALRNFGVPVGEMPSTVADAKRMLNNIAIDEATAILKESGKTLSDTDRERVIERVGKINWTSGDVELIKRQLKDIYELTVLKPQKNLDLAKGWLERNAGISFSAPMDSMPTQEELDALNEKYGTNLTMDDFKESGA